MARRAQPLSRRRTSEVDSRRPDFDRNSAASAVDRLQERAPTRQVALERLPGVLADWDEASLAALALHADGLGVEVERLDV